MVCYSRGDFKRLADPGASWGSLETGISGGSCGTGGKDGGRVIVVLVAECRVAVELMLVRGPKAGDEAGETHAVCLHLWKQLASWGSPLPAQPPRKQKLETRGTL